MCKTGASMPTEAAPGLSGWIDGRKEGKRGGRWREIIEGEGRTTNKCLPRGKKTLKYSGTRECQREKSLRNRRPGFTTSHHGLGMDPPICWNKLFLLKDGWGWGTMKVGVHVTQNNGPRGEGGTSG